MSAQSKIVLAAAVAALVVVIIGEVKAQQAPTGSGQGPAMAPGPDCLTAVLNASDCLGYVAPGSKERLPDKACCPELAGLVESQPLCLCQLLGGSVAAAYGVSIDTTRALALPKACHVDTPPPSLCAAIGYPINFGSPAPSPATSPLLPGSTPTAHPSAANCGIRGRLRAGDLAFLAALLYTVAVAVAAVSGVF